MTVTIAVADDAMRQRLEGTVGDANVVAWNIGDAPLATRIDLFVLPYVTVFGALAALDPAAVAVVQSQSLGYDGVRDLLPAGISFANAVGVHEAPTAELAVALALSAQRGMADFAVAQLTGSWDRPMLPGLAGNRVLLIGVGGVGAEIEKRIVPFDVTLTKVARTARDGVHAQSELPTLLPLADIVILAVPLSAATEGLVDSAFLDAMRPGALLVNISRGAVVDTDTMTERVASGRLRVALDVMSPEPLPADHPLWTLPGATITPHIGGNVQSMSARIDPLVREQIRRLEQGEKLANIVFDAQPDS